MFTKESKLYSIFNSKCPQCHEGEFFENKLSFNVFKTTETKTNCPKCNLKYMREPSFFYGAMYTGYGLSVAFAIFLYLVSVLFFDLSMRQSIVVIAIGLTVIAPWSLRISRVMWIHLFVKYQKDPAKRIQ